jgi:hypothetical protein
MGLRNLLPELSSSRQTRQVGYGREEGNVDLTRMTPSPRTNNISTFLLAICERSHKTHQSVSIRRLTNRCVC